MSKNHFIAFKLLALLRDKVFRALRRLCPAKLEGRDKGDLISVITSDIELLEVFYAHTISPAAIAFLFTIVMCLFIGSYHWLLGLIALAAYLTVGIVIPLVTSKLSGDDGMKFRTKPGDLSGFVLDSLRGLSETLQYGQGKKRLAQMNEKTDALAKDEERMKRTSGRNSAVTNTVVLAFDLVMLFVSALLCQSGAVGFDGVLIPTIALFSSFGPAIALAALGSTLQNTFAAGNRVLDILDETPVVEEVTGRPEIAFTGAAAEQVTFSYGKETILSDVSVKIPKHSVVGIVGRSGSGKSTLLKLFMRFWDVQKGSVTLSGTRVADIDTNNLREMESFVTQETHLFHDSIKNNLRIAKLTATDEEIDDFQTLFHTMGLSPDPKEDEEKIRRAMEITHTYKHRDKPVSELSGGQKQRVWIAMALAQDTKVLFLDEPTTYLDIRYQLQILKLIRQLNREFGITIVMVLHDINQSLYYSDEIVAMKDGRMIAHGLPEEIISGELVQEVYDVNLDIRTVDGKPFVIPV